MDTLKFNVYTDTATMDTAEQAKGLDIADEAIASNTELTCLTSGGVGCIPNPADFYVTAAIPSHEYYEIQFDLSNTFWGCPFNFGNSACGVNIRQAFAHLVDKNLYAIGSKGLIHGVALDNPVPPSLGLPTPNSCSWDPMFPEVSSPIGNVGICQVGGATDQAGGVAYHLATAAAGNCATTPLFTWEPGCGTPDFCAAAAHLVAAGVATGKDPTTCLLTGIGLGPLGDPKAHAVDMMTRSSYPRHELGNGVADEICALFTGKFRNVGVDANCPNVSTTDSAPTGNYISQTVGPISAMPGFTTSTKSTITNDWWAYTAGFINVQPFDTFYGPYNSVFASNNGPNTGTFGVGDVLPCSTQSVPTGGASDYMYNCQSAYDSISNQLEFSPCLSAAGDTSPIPLPNPTFGVCPTAPAGSFSAGNIAVTADNTYSHLPFSSTALDIQPVTITSLGFTGSGSVGVTQTGPSATPLLTAPATFTLSAAQPFTTIHNLITVPSGTVAGTYDEDEFCGTVPIHIHITITVTATDWSATVTQNALSAVGAGYQSEFIHGSTVVTLPIFGQRTQFAYLSNFSRVINGPSQGISNFFTWMSAWSSTPAAAGALLENCPTAPAVIGPDCIRSAMSQATDGLNPYTSNSYWDAFVMGDVWDSLIANNPLNPSQLFGYMTTGFPTQLSNPQLGYTPAPGTTTSFRFTLRNDIFFHDGAPLTAFDVKYSYITYKSSGGPASVGLVQMTDVHALSTTTFDVNLSTFGPFTLNSIGSSSILPGRHWSAAGLSAWDAAINTCKTSTTPDSCFSTAAPGAFAPAAGVTSPKYDPIAAGNLIGSSAWQCAAVPGLLNPSGAAIGGGCSSTGLENPGVGGYYQLTQFGAGTTPGTAVPSTQYFRSSGKLAIYIWSGNNGGSTHDFLNSSTVASCFLKAVGTASCTQWQKGISNPSAAGATVGFLQVSAATSFNGVHWTAPFDYLAGVSYACCAFTPNAPDGVAPLPLLLYAGVSNGNTGNPFASGAQETLQPAATAGCATAYPSGGYDC